MSSKLHIGVQIKLIHLGAKLPTVSTIDSAGADIYAITDTIIPARSRVPVDTGVCMCIPDGYVGIAKSRSGLAFKYGIDTEAGVIDADYRGEIKVCLSNNSDKDYMVKRHDRITQMLFIPIARPTFLLVEELQKTDRGIDGFGSTGK